MLQFIYFSCFCWQKDNKKK